jgi:hypothetical protein
MTNRRSTLVACGAVAVALMLATTAHAWIGGHRMNNLTFSGPVALPGVALAAGAYIFERADMDTRLIRVFSQDRSRVLYTGFTRTVTRPAGMRADRSVTFGEAPAGAPPRITAWYPVGGSTGHQFIYAK